MARCSNCNAVLRVVPKRDEYGNFVQPPMVLHPDKAAKRHCVIQAKIRERQRMERSQWKPFRDDALVLRMAGIHT